MVLFSWSIWQKLPYHYVYQEWQFIMSAYTNHVKTTSVKSNNGWKSTLTEWEHCTLKRLVLKNHTTTAAQVTAELNIHLEDPVPTKTVWHELHKSNIHGKAATAKPMITESNAQMFKQCHGHKTWTSDKWKWSHDMVRWVGLHAVPYIRKSLHLENTQGSLQSGVHGSNSKTWGRFCDGLGSNIVIQYSVGPIITLHGQITAREYLNRLGNQVHPMIQT
jgi:hypothetical protein